MTGAPLTSRDVARINATPPLQGRGKGWGVAVGKQDELLARARAMRAQPTEPEKRLWRVLSGAQLSGYKFRRQSVIGDYIVDFLCPSKGLVVEVDGDTHDDIERDAQRDTYLRAQGYGVVHVTNHDVMANIGGVCDLLLAHLKALPGRRPPHPNPSPEGEGLMNF